MSELELDDIQGIILSSYAKLGFARFVLLNVEDAEGGRRW